MISEFSYKIILQISMFFEAVVICPYTTNPNEIVIYPYSSYPQLMGSVQYRFLALRF